MNNYDKDNIPYNGYFKTFILSIIEIIISTYITVDIINNDNENKALIVFSILTTVSYPFMTACSAILLPKKSDCDKFSHLSDNTFYKKVSFWFTFNSDFSFLFIYSSLVIKPYNIVYPILALMFNFNYILSTVIYIIIYNYEKKKYLAEQSLLNNTNN